MNIIAGFECAFLESKGVSLQDMTRHLPEADMSTHYDIVKAHGIRMVRDGLHPFHNPRTRMRVARDSGVTPIWDLQHFYRIDAPEQFARQIAYDHIEVNGLMPLWVCPINEPEITPMFLPGQSREEGVIRAMRMLYVLRQMLPKVNVLTVDPLWSLAGPWYGNDALQAQADVIGVNLYPHDIKAPISDLLVAAGMRYRKPIMISETSWHDGFHEWPDVHNKLEWMLYVESEVEKARLLGVDVFGVCWYPIVESPNWDTPWTDERWSNGLIRRDLTVDPMLAAFLKRKG